MIGERKKLQTNPPGLVTVMITVQFKEPFTLKFLTVKLNGGREGADERLKVGGWKKKRKKKMSLFVS